MTDAMTPDPREGKQPGWVQDTLAELRGKVRNMESEVAAVKGEHEGSNVRLVNRTSLKDTPLPPSSMVAFDSKWGKVTVHHDLDGRVRIQGDSALIVRLNAGNALTVELEDA